MAPDDSSSSSGEFPGCEPFEPDMQLCAVCREEKLMIDFGPSSRASSRPVCRSCSNAQRVEWAQGSVERARRIRSVYSERKKLAPGKTSAAQWTEILQRYGHRCAYCGVSGEPLIREHVVPLSRGGTNDPSNLVPSCRSCNAQKNNRLDFNPVLPYPENQEKLNDP